MQDDCLSWTKVGLMRHTVASLANKFRSRPRRHLSATVAAFNGMQNMMEGRTEAGDRGGGGCCGLGKLTTTQGYAAIRATGCSHMTVTWESETNRIRY